MYDTPFVVEGGDKLPAKNIEVSYVMPSDSPHTAGAHKHAVYSVPEFHDRGCEKAGWLVRFQDPETDSELFALKSRTTLAGSLKFTMPAGAD